MNRLVYSIAAMLTLVGCERLIGAVGTPIVGISVERRGADYLFSFRNCSDAAKPVGLAEISVIPDVPVARIDSTAPLCKVVQDSGEQITHSWRYGDTPPGYSGVCKPLVPGHRYQIRLGGRGHMAFSLAADGSVLDAEAACRWK
jgi:hypothetical protein